MDEVLTKNEAVEFLKMSPKTIDYLIVSDQIPYSRLGKRSVRSSRTMMARNFIKCLSGGNYKAVAKRPSLW